MTPERELVQAEVVVIGAGPAGLSAALAAARAGARVTLIDNNHQPGGQYFRQPAVEFRVRKLAGHQRVGQALTQRVTAAGVRLLTETTVWGAFEDKVLALYGPEAPEFIRAQAIVLARGAYERPAAFPGWTLPGVMMSGAAQILLKSQRILPGQRVVLAGTGPLQLVVAAGLVQAGAQVVALLDGSPLLRILFRPLHNGLALWGQWSRLAEGLSSWWTLRRAGVPFRTGWGVLAAHGQDQLTGVTIAQLDDQWRPRPDTATTLACDTLCCGYGFIPATHLSRLLGVRHEWQPRRGGWVPLRDRHLQTNVPGVFAAGDCAGIGGAELAVIEGELAGRAAAAQVQGNGLNPSHEDAANGELERLRRAMRREQRFQQLYSELFTPGPGLDDLARPETIVCRCEGVTRAQVSQAVQSGADTLAMVKGIARCGMGNCQGRICGPLVATLVAQETGRDWAQVGQFSVRPPIFPIPVAALAPRAEHPSN